MNQREVIAFFNRCAPEWDAANIRDDGKIGFILDAAGIRPGCSVLDVACGTGVLFPDYLARGVSRVTGVDISPEMARIATAMLHDPAWRCSAAMWKRWNCLAGMTAVWFTTLFRILRTRPGW